MNIDQGKKVPKKSINKIQQEVQNSSGITLSVDCVIFGFDENKLKVLLIRSDITKFKGQWSLLGDLVDPNEDIDEAAHRIVFERTGMSDVYLEQVETFGKIKRHPAGRVVTVAYYSLLNIHQYSLKKFDNEIHWHDVSSVTNLAFDHQEIFDTCNTRLQKRILEHPLGFNLLPKKFSLRELQNLYESILELKMDRRNFRKKFFAMDLLTDLDEVETDVTHRPGKLYQFNFNKYQNKKKSWAGIDF